MALKLPGGEFFAETSPKNRVLMMLAVITGVGGLVYFVAGHFGGGAKTGASQVAAAPKGLQSVPGGDLSGEYYKAIMESNAQAAQQAQITGGSAVPTLVNMPSSQQQLGGTNEDLSDQSCSVVCPNPEEMNTSDQIAQMVKDGKLPKVIASQLLALVKNNATVSEYENALGEMVRQGKLTPEQARQLLVQYKRQHENGLIAESGRMIDELTKNGKVSLAAGNELLALQRSHLSPAEYENELSRLVREKKISPEVAAQLLAQYTQQQVREANRESVADLKRIAKTGALMPEVAASLEALETKNIPVDQLAAELQKLVAAGKLTPETAAVLLEQYKSRRIKMSPTQVSEKTVMPSLALSHDDYKKQLDQLVRDGKITPQEAARLQADHAIKSGLVNEALSQDDYKKQLDQLVRDGKITPQEAARLQADHAVKSGLVNEALSQGDYKKQLDQLVRDGKLAPQEAARLLADHATKSELVNEALNHADYKKQLDQLVQDGKLTPEKAAQLLANHAAKAGLPSEALTQEEYKKQLDQLVHEGKLAPENATKLLAQHAKQTQMEALQQRLLTLQTNNASADAYTDELKKAVLNKTITPEKAAALLREYQAITSRVTVPPPVTTTAAAPSKTPSGGTEFEKLQQRVQEQQQNAPGTAAASGQQQAQQAQQFEEAAAAAEKEANEERDQRIQRIQTAMSGQAQSLLTAWAAPKMAHMGSTPSATSGLSTTTSTTKTTTTGDKAESEAMGRPIIKAGTILFAVLDTAVDSDYPDTPVMATIVGGPMKGAKIMGKLALQKDQDKVTLNFNLMDMDDWPKTKSITAFGIDPDTAKTVLASDVDHHYMKRFGAMMATSFISGYSTAIQSSGSTSTPSVLGTTTTRSVFSPTEKLAVGLGQIGTALSGTVSGYITTPATVKVNAGVGLGILFMADVSK